MAFRENEVSGERSEQGGCSSGTGTHRLQQEIDSTRCAMDQTIDKLAQRLTPRKLLNEAMGSLRGSRKAGAGNGGPENISAGNVGKMLLDQARQHPVPTALVASAAMAPGLLAVWIKRHPIPAALIAGGVVWMMKESRGEKRGEAVESGLLYGRPYGSGANTEDSSGLWDTAAEKMSEASRGAKDAAARSAEQLRQFKGRAVARAQEVGERVRGLAGDAGKHMKEGYEQAGASASRAVEDYPLAVCAASLAAGMLVGFAVPHTRREDDLYGAQASRFKGDVKQRVRDVTREARDVTMQTVKDQAREQGLTVEALREKATQVAKGTVEAAKEVVREKLGTGSQPDGGSQPGQQARGGSSDLPGGQGPFSQERFE